MELTPNERRILELMLLQYLTREEGTKVVPEDIRTKFTPETVQFTLAELQAKGLVEYLEGGYAPTKKAEELLKEKEKVKDEIIAFGHPKILGTNEKKIEITKEDEPLNDSVIAVKANKACKDLDILLKDYLKFGKELKITISTDGIKDIVTAHGSPALESTDEENITVGKSDFIDEKTLAILADKAACDLKREMIKRLKDPETKVKIELKIK